ncbi:DUF4407 domain-containing protein [Mucilaginibacter rubeus]|uniref:DUF4407 domain-containing protein n=1 Tax=Mucilaginibacter rubeus TaxID=2027860 RepID=A0A5C1HV73_9SPHI|nr:DUF4407 domain-containing protein [Mucilaginibacter rubeus]QEM09041.1 DUF4407 domain-containing protein [Mucilaginibacter rubeus]
MPHPDQTPPKNRFIHFRKKYFPFLWFIAAADEGLLLHCPIPEQDKQAGIGVAILCTSIAACISSYYAIHSLFGTWTTALPLALFWGLIILNLDRFMVVSMRKTRENNWLQNIWVVSPRIVLALFIAVLISKPLEVRIFLNQIEAATTAHNEILQNKALIDRSQLVDKVKGEAKDSNTALENAIRESRNRYLDPVYTDLDKSYKESLAQAEGLRQQKIRLQSRLSITPEEAPGRPGLEAAIGRVRRTLENQNNNSRSLKQQRDDRGAEYDKKQSIIVNRLQENNIRLLGTAQSQEDSLNHKKNILAQKVDIASKDILGQLSVLDDLKEHNPGMAAANLLITTLFFLLELAPVLVKMGSHRGKYDTLLSILEQQALDEEEAAIEESRQGKIVRANAAVRNTGKAAELDSELKEQVKGEILTAQAALAKKIVVAWQQQEEEALKRNPSGYLEHKITTADN